MRRSQKIAELEHIAQSFGIDVRYEKMGMIPGGLCRLGDKQVLFINKSLSEQSKLELLVNELKNFDIDSLFLLPEIRELLQ